jgi:hypothetical protein
MAAIEPMRARTPQRFIGFTRCSQSAIVLASFKTQPVSTECVARTERRPVLTAAARDGVGNLWAGRKDAPQGANQKIVGFTVDGCTPPWTRLVIIGGGTPRCGTAEVPLCLEDDASACAPFQDGRGGEAVSFPGRHPGRVSCPFRAPCGGRFQPALRSPIPQ